MFQRLRKKLREWLMEEEEQPLKFDLEVMEGNKNVLYHITERKGIHLLGRPIGGIIKVRLIQKNEAADQEHFDKLWFHFCRHANLEWEE